MNVVKRRKSAANSVKGEARILASMLKVFTNDAREARLSAMDLSTEVGTLKWNSLQRLGVVLLWRCGC